MDTTGGLAGKQRHKYQYIYAMTKNTTFNFIKRKRLEQSYQGTIIAEISNRRLTKIRKILSTLSIIKKHY